MGTLIIILGVECIAYCILWLYVIIEGWRMLKRGEKFKQPKLCTYGLWIGLGGIIFVSVIPRLMNIREVYSFYALSMYDLSALIGLGFNYIGMKLYFAAFKSKEETPTWLKRIITWLPN